MKKLSDFEGNKVDLKEVQGGMWPLPSLSGYFIPDRPTGHPDGPGKIHWVFPDVNVAGISISLEESNSLTGS